MTPEERARITEVIVNELRTVVAAAQAAGVTTNEIQAELDRRREAIQAR